jgi:hypothetical protein
MTFQNKGGFAIWEKKKTKHFTSLLANILMNPTVGHKKY